MVVRVLNPVNTRRPFKYFDYWAKHPNFTSIVQHVWDSPVDGFSMYRLVSKLKMLKGRLKHLNKEVYSNISLRTDEAREALRVAQLELQLDPNNSELADLEKLRRRLFVDLRINEESFYKQKSRVRWLKEGDRNTKFFHLSVKKRQLRNRILSVKNSSGDFITDIDLVPQVFVSYFADLLAPQVSLTKPSLQELKEFIRRPLSMDQVSSLSSPILDTEIRDTLFSLPRGKAPGPDGFTAEFFKSNWDIVGSSVIESVNEFFSSGRLLREVNNTILALVPKVPNACAVSDFRPIACCNTIYKIITKILANRLAVVLSDVVDPSQNAFIKGRRIRDNILMAQELFAGFHLDPYLPKCAIKVDFQKAYDTVDWDFL